MCFKSQLELPTPTLPRLLSYSDPAVPDLSGRLLCLGSLPSRTQANSRDEGNFKEQRWNRRQKSKGMNEGPFRRVPENRRSEVFDEAGRVDNV